MKKQIQIFSDPLPFIFKATKARIDFSVRFSHRMHGPDYTEITFDRKDLETMAEIFRKTVEFGTC